MVHSYNYPHPTKTKKGELKPCPFCGGKAVLQIDVRYPRPQREPRRAYEVFCVNNACVLYKADDKYFLNRKKAVEAWNTRYESEV